MDRIFALVYGFLAQYESYIEDHNLVTTDQFMENVN
jgi:hypothetical protein